jgi:hypothetical protein
MTRLTLLFVVAALVIPGAASAMSAPDRDPGTRAALNQGVDAAAVDARTRAIEAYYSSYGEPQPIAASQPAPVADDHTGPSWFGAIGIGVALMLIAGGLGVYARRSVRPRHIGA